MYRPLASILRHRPPSSSIYVTQKHPRYKMASEVNTAKKKFGNTETLRHVKHKEKMKGNLPVSGVISLQILGTGNYDVPRSLLLSTDHNKYLFNCGEGTQRLINEHKLKASRLEHIFITHRSWENVGGLLGMALTLQAVNVPLIKIHGPPDVEKGVRMSRNFADVKAAGVEKIDVGSGPLSDHTFKIESVLLKRTKNEFHESKRARLTIDKDLAVAYICRPQPYPRKVDLAKCVELGIKKGPLIGELKKGETVTLEDGRTIYPDQILDDPQPSRPILVVELPSMDYFDSLVDSEPIKQLQIVSLTNENGKSDDLENAAEIVVHMSRDSIIDDPRYRQWMKGFSLSCRHLTFDESASGPSSKSPYRCQAMLNQIHDRIFPLLSQQTTQTTRYAPEDLESSIVKVSTNLSYNYRPRKEFDTTGCVTLDYDEYIQESHAQEGFKERLEELKTLLGTIPEAYEEVRYPHLVFLGTGSSVPSNTRNVSAFLLHLDENTCILFDCGEGTLGQIWRFYGEKTRDILAKLKCVMISHLHADHHLGVFTLLLERFRLYNDEPWYRPLDVVAPVGYKRWAESFLSEFVNVDRCMTLYENHSLLPQNLRAENIEDLLSSLGLRSLKTVSVKHCKGSFGFVLVLNDGRKITYSGDTMPCENLIEAGADSDLLIHEATMENDLIDEAVRKTHSTTSQAIDVGQKMNAKFTLLTHFSQRYAKIPVFGDEFKDMMNVGIAFDFMRVDFEQLRLLPLFIPVLKALFAEHYAELEANIEKRHIKARAIELAAKSREASDTDNVKESIQVTSKS